MADHNLKAVLPPHLQFLNCRFVARPAGFSMSNAENADEKVFLTADSAIIYGATIVLTQASLDHFVASTAEPEGK